jgi:small subunit ribosomal protein S2
VFITDVRREQIAVKEANKLDIPIIGMVDTNCDPTPIDYIIPANDDAIRSIRLICTKLADAVIEGQHIRAALLAEEEEEMAEEAEEWAEREPEKEVVVTAEEFMEEPESEDDEEFEVDEDEDRTELQRESIGRRRADTDDTDETDEEE